MDTKTKMNNTSRDTTTCTKWNTISISDEEATEEWLHSDIDDLIAGYLMPAVIIVSGLSNSAFIFMVARLRRMHTITNMYLVIISIADLMLGMITPSLYISAYFSSPVTNHIPYSDVSFCFIAFFIPYYGYLVSVGMITLVSFERYLAVCKPLQHMRMQTKSRAMRMTIVVVIVATILAFVVTPAKGKLVRLCLKWPQMDDDLYNNLQTHFHTCQPMGTGIMRNIFAIMTDAIEVGSLMVAMAVNSVLYAFIIHTLSTRSVASAQSSLQDQTIQVRNQVARALVINGIVFFLTQTPFRVHSLNQLVEKMNGTGFFSKGQSSTAELIGRGLLFFNSSVNSFIYAFSCKFYRDGFRDAFFFRAKKKQNNNKMASLGSNYAHDTSVTNAC